MVGIDNSITEIFTSHLIIISKSWYNYWNNEVQIEGCAFVNKDDKLMSNNFVFDHPSFLNEYDEAEREGLRFVILAVYI